MVATNPAPSMLDAALAYVALGWAVLPCWGVQSNGACACTKYGCDDIGKHPIGQLVPHGLKDATKDAELVHAWWTRYPEANVGIATGEISGIDVLDVDGDEGRESLRTHEKDHGALPDTVEAITGGGGRHLLFVHKPGLKNRVRLAPGLDVRTTGGYVVAAPSLHRSGKRYEWEAAHTPEGHVTAYWPEQLADLAARKPSPLPAAAGGTRATPRPDVGFTRYGAKALEAETTRLRAAPQGTRNDTLNGVAFNLAQLHAGAELPDVSEDLVGIGMEIGLGEQECRKTIGSAWRAGLQKPRSAPPRTSPSPAPERRAVSLGEERDTPAELGPNSQEGTSGAPADEPPPFDEEEGPPDLPPEDAEPEEAPRELETDLGNARRMVRMHGDHLFHTAAHGWLIWDGTRWKRDETKGSKRLAISAIDSLWSEARTAGQHGDSEKAKAKFQHALKSQSARSIAAALELASADGKVAAEQASFDAHPWLLNCRNGVFDLKTGKLGKHDQALRLTRRIEASYYPNAGCPMWEEFLEQVLPDPDVRAFIQRFSGYTLAGVRGAQVFAFLYGAGGNGKSTLLDVLAAIFGDYGAVTPFDTFLERQPGQATNDLARLAGARFVRASEPDEGAVLSESVVKQATGGEPITARFHRQEFFEFKPEFALWLSGNHHPRVKGTDDGIWRRVILIPFTVKIEKGEDPDVLKARLLSERDGILRWMWAGCEAWQRVGLNPPKAVKEATHAYRSDQDVVGRFLDEKMVLTLKECDWITVKALRGAYEDWCKDNGERAMSQRALAERLHLRRLENARMPGTGATIWRGLCWRENATHMTAELPVDGQDL